MNSVSFSITVPSGQLQVGMGELSPGQAGPPLKTAISPLLQVQVASTPTPQGFLSLFTAKSLTLFSISSMSNSSPFSQVQIKSGNPSGQWF